MRTALFISPHLDDAVLSCAGMMQRRRAAGERIIVATVFTKGSCGYEQRRKEDECAVASLGAEFKHLGHPDAPDRRAAYSSFRQIIFGWLPADEKTIANVAETLKSLWDATQAREMFVPLGVGTHVDHRIVHAAARRLPNTPISFYEERPYAYAPGAAELRLRELGFDAGEVDVRALLRGFRQLPHVKFFLPQGCERSLCEALLIAPLASHARKGAIASLLPCTSAEAAQARKAAKHYASQFTAFCGTSLQMTRMDLSYSRKLGTSSPRTERFWQFQ